jgi:hypothetical protein
VVGKIISFIRNANPWHGIISPQKFRGGLLGGASFHLLYLTTHKKAFIFLLFGLAPRNNSMNQAVFSESLIRFSRRAAAREGSITSDRDCTGT